MSIFYDPRTRSVPVWIIVVFLLSAMGLIGGFWAYGQARVNANQSKSMSSK